MHNKALALFKKTLGAEHPLVAMSYNNLGATYYKQGKYQEAEKYFKDALAIRERLLGENHPYTKGTARWLKDAQQALKKQQDKYAIM